MCPFWKKRTATRRRGGAGKTVREVSAKYGSVAPPRSLGGAGLASSRGRTLQFQKTDSGLDVDLEAAHETQTAEAT